MKLKRLAIFVTHIAPVANLVILVIGSTWAVVEWYKFKYDTDGYALRQLKVDTEAAEQKPFETESELSVTDLKRYPDGSHLYDVAFAVSAKNLSKSQITVSYSIAELYLGDADTHALKVGKALAINSPPDPWHTFPQSPINWNRQAYEADIADGITNEKVLSWMHSHFDALGKSGLTGILSTGETTLYDPEFLVRAVPNQYVAVVMSLGVNDSLDVAGPNLDILMEMQRLDDMNKK